MTVGCRVAGPENRMEPEPIKTLDVAFSPVVVGCGRHQITPTGPSHRICPVSPCPGLSGTYTLFRTRLPLSAHVYLFVQ